MDEPPSHQPSPETWLVRTRDSAQDRAIRRCVRTPHRRSLRHSALPFVDAELAPHRIDGRLPLKGGVIQGRSPQSIRRGADAASRE